MFSHEVSEIFKNTYFEDQWWRVWTRRDLDRVQSIFLNVTILFKQMQPYNLYVS